jgi:hypothetical protein
MVITIGNHHRGDPQLASQVTPRKTFGGGACMRLCQQAGPSQPVQRQPDHGLVQRRLQVLAKELGHVRHAGRAVAMAPDQSGRAIQAVGLVTPEIVHQRFTVYLTHHQPSSRLLANIDYL